MPGFDGTGPRGLGPMTGGGRGFCSPWGIRTVPGSYSYPGGVGYPYYGVYRPGPLTPRMTREQELEFLKTEAQNLRDELNELEARIGQLSTEKE
jgi:hypothetical protein